MRSRTSMESCGADCSAASISAGSVAVMLARVLAAWSFVSTMGSGRIDATSSGSGDGIDPRSPTTMPEPNVLVSSANTVDAPGRGPAGAERHDLAQHAGQLVGHLLGGGEPLHAGRCAWRA